VKIPYPIISRKNPFFYITVNGFDLTSVTTTGDTVLRVYRVWKNTTGDDIPATSNSLNMPPNYTSPYNIPPYYSGNNNGASAPVDPVDYTPIEQKKNKFTFVFDEELFDMEAGRYRADFYYKGTYVSHTYIVYSKKDTSLVGSINV
jgi:hypothetical protein